MDTYSPHSAPLAISELGSGEQRQPEVVIPVIREDWQVHKELRDISTVRVQKSVHEYEELVRDSLASEAIEVVRIPMNQVVSSAPAVRTEGNVTIIPVVKEFAVLTKELRVVEEIRITKTQSHMGFEQPVLVRAEEVTVERVPSGFAQVTPQAQDASVLTFLERREEAVVTKSARVVEEILIATEASERVVTVRDTVRHSEVEVERFDEPAGEKTAVATGQ